MRKSLIILSLCLTVFANLPPIHENVIGNSISESNGSDSHIKPSNLNLNAAKTTTKKTTWKTTTKKTSRKATTPKTTTRTTIKPTILTTTKSTTTTTYKPIYNGTCPYGYFYNEKVCEGNQKTNLFN